MPAVLRRDEPTGQNYVIKYGISQSLVGGAIVKVIDEVLDFVETKLDVVVSLDPPENLEVS